MIIHFICRGNAFRSIIAEAYLNSLKIKDLSVLSSGTAAIVHKARNLANHRMTLDLLEEHGIREFAKSGYGDQLTQSRLDKADITVCMNQRVYDECLECVTFPASPRVWSVADIGEPGRISDIELERQLYRAEAYQEIVRNVERLVSDVLDGQTRLTLVAYETRALTSANEYVCILTDLLLLASGPGSRSVKRGETTLLFAHIAAIRVCGSLASTAARASMNSL